MRATSVIQGSRGPTPARNRSAARLGAVVAFVVASATPAFAQLDPLYFMKKPATPAPTNGALPNVVLVVDTSNRMQRDAPTDNTDTTTAQATSNYYDPFVYTKTGAIWEADLGVSGSITTSVYRRKYRSMVYASNGTDKFSGSTICVTGNGGSTCTQDTVQLPYSDFDAPTRLAIARAAMYQAVNENKSVARFGLIRTRQSSPQTATQGNSGPVDDADPLQLTPTDLNRTDGRWAVARPLVSTGGSDGATSTSGLLVQADSSSANTTVLSTLAKDVRTSGALLPAGNDDANTIDTPVYNLLSDAKTEVTRLIGLSNDPTCRNTIVVLIVGGGEGTTSGKSNADLGALASAFVNISSRRVPIYVIALAPPQKDARDASDVRASLQAIATNSGGQYFEITKAQIDAALGSPLWQATAGAAAPTGTVIVPEVVKAIDTAVQHTFASSTDFNTAPTATLPYGPSTEYQVTSPIIGTVNLNLAKDITGTTLPNPQPPDVKDKQGNVIPQRNNVMVTTGVAMPGFDAKLRAFRVYKPVVDSTQPSGYKFSADGTRLWVASTPPADQRNLFTLDASGNVIAFTTANAATIAPLMGVNAAGGAAISTSDASAIITAVRGLGLGAVLDSTPAIMNPPSLDPPPDDAYPGFATANTNRRAIVWVGTNRGIMEAIDARTGLEVWGFIPPNLLPKLRTLVDGQPVGNFDFFMDGSPKISDVRLAGICAASQPSNCWRTHLIVGEGPGGTFYLSFDVTLDTIDGGNGSAACIAPDDDTQSTLLGCFNSTSVIKVNWTFPSWGDFDPTLSVAVHCNDATTSPAYKCDSLPYGDLKSGASSVEKTVGQTWSDPAVGQIGTSASPYSVLIGSGFLPYDTQQQANRSSTVAGTTFYILDAKTGSVYASSNVGSDGTNETVNNCLANSTGCKQMKNALQTDPVATGPSDQRFITKAYLGDLDGNVWRFDISLDANSLPTIPSQTKLFASGSDQPIFSSMATVNVGGVNQYVFYGTGSDLLPATDKNTTYHMLGILDTGGSSATKSMDHVLAKTTSLTSDERVTAFPAVAGDIVFFTTTTLNSSDTCAAPNANLYAFTFLGGAAYDTNNDGVFDKSDSVLVKTVAGQRATAPFIVDQHLVFATGSKVSLFGDPDDYNNGVGEAGVRILSWREVR